MQKSLFCLSLLTMGLITPQANAITLISQMLEQPLSLQANPELNDPEIMAVQQQYAQCWDNMYSELSKQYSDDKVVRYENSVEAAVEEYQAAILSGITIKKPLEKLVKSFEELGMYLLKNREATPEITTQYCSVLLVICSTTTLVKLAAQTSIDLQKLDNKTQQNMQKAGTELSKRLQDLFSKTFGFTLPQIQE